MAQEGASNVPFTIACRFADMVVHLRCNGLHRLCKGFRALFRWSTDLGMDTPNRGFSLNPRAWYHGNVYVPFDPEHARMNP